MNDINKFVRPQRPPKFFSIDIDKTFYVDDKDVFERNKNSIVFLRSKGIIPFFSTSRFYTSAMGLLGDDYLKDTGHNGFPGVYSDGCCVFDENGKMLYLRKFSREFLDKYVKYVKDNKMEDKTIFITPFESFVVSEPHIELRVNIDQKNIHVPERSTLDVVYQHDIVCVIHVYSDSEIKGLEKDRDYIYHLYGNVVALTPPRVTKSDGILMLLKHYNADPSDCAHIGDGENDIAAMECCGLSFAVGNAKDIVKEHANWVIDLNYDQGAFEKAVKVVYGM